MASEEMIVEAVVEYLFKDYSGEVADRLLLVQEDLIGKAKVSNARYLGGWSKDAARNAVLRSIKKAQENKL